MGGKNWTKRQAEIRDFLDNVLSDFLEYFMDNFFNNLLGNFRLSEVKHIVEESEHFS